MNYSINNLISQLSSSIGKTKENYHINDDAQKLTDQDIINISILLLVSLLVWIFALMKLIKYYRILPPWAQVTGTLALGSFNMFGSIITLLIVYSAL